MTSTSAGRGIGGQLLLVIPSREIVAVITRGTSSARTKNLFDPLLAALVG